MIWQCRPWYGSIWSGSEWSGLARSGLVLHMQIWDDLTYLNTKFNEITSSCIGVNMAIMLSFFLYSDVVAVCDTCKEWQVKTWYVFCLKNAFTNNMFWNVKWDYMFHVCQNTILNLHCEQFQNRSNMGVVLVIVITFMPYILLFL